MNRDSRGDSNRGAAIEYIEREIPIDRIHPDPVQPRVHPDAELAESIRSQGILQAIRVEELQELDAICDHCDRTFTDLAAESGHFMIQDGERRFRGSIAAGRKTVLAKVVAPLSEGKRLLTQLTSNTGKPLTVIEEAFAFRRIMDAEGWSQNELSRQLGRPRSLVGDRIRLTDLHPAWLEAISSGKLQASHAPIIAIFSPVPDEYQAKACANLLADYRSTMRFNDGDSIPVDEFRTLIYSAHREYIKPISDVRSYKGPTLKFKAYPGAAPTTYAADIEQWRPIARAAEKRRRKEMQAQASTRTNPSASGQKRDGKKVLDELERSDVPQRAQSEYNATANKGETIIFKANDSSHSAGWQEGIDPAVLLQNVDPSKLVRVYAKHDAALMTTDVDALELARQSWNAKLWPLIEKAARKLAHRINPVLADCTLAGVGVRKLLDAMSGDEDSFRDDDDEFVFAAAAVGIKPSFITEVHHGATFFRLDTFAFSDEECAKVMSAYAATLATRKNRWDSDVPRLDDIRGKLRDSMQGVKLELPKQAPVAVRRATSKESGHARGKALAIARAANAEIAERRAGKPADLPAGEHSCIKCGCTESNACPAGCHWVSTNPYICSECAPALMSQDPAAPQVLEEATA